MSSNSNIEWTETTWNVTTGCTEASRGCNNCYARVMTKRLGAMARADRARGNDPGRKSSYELAVLDNGKWSGAVTTVPEALTDPLRWKKPRRIFVNSMSDLFWGTERDLADARRRGVDAKPVPFEFIDKVFAVMALCPQHTFQVLTKRPERMAAYFNGKPFGEEGWGVFRGEMGVRETLADWECGGCDWLNELPVWSEETGLLLMAHAGGELNWPLPNAWLGTSVEDQKTADERIPHLLKCPAAVRWLSMEPLLGPVDLEAITDKNRFPGCADFDVLRGRMIHHDDDFKWTEDESIHWVVAGGESGGGARLMDIDWVRSIRDQCQAAGVPVFIKQLGKEPYGFEVLRCHHCGTSGPSDMFDVAGADDGNVFCNQCGREIPCEYNLNDKKGGDMDEWPEDLRVREYPETTP